MFSFCGPLLVCFFLFFFSLLFFFALRLPFLPSSTHPFDLVFLKLETRFSLFLFLCVLEFVFFPLWLAFPSSSFDVSFFFLPFLLRTFMCDDFLRLYFAATFFFFAFLCHRLCSFSFGNFRPVYLFYLFVLSTLHPSPLFPSLCVEHQILGCCICDLLCECARRRTQKLNFPLLCLPNPISLGLFFFLFNFSRTHCWT